MKAELTRSMFLSLSKFANEQKINMNDKDFIKALHNVVENLANDNTNVKPNENRNIHAKLSKFHDEIVQRCIDFVKENPELIDEINKTKESTRVELLKKYGSFVPNIEPDVRIYFGIDGFDESIKEGKWVPDTDSYMSLTVGNKTLYESI